MKTLKLWYQELDRGLVHSLNKTMIIGIAGGSGSGKTTVAERLFQAIGAETACVISHDSYYKDQSNKAPSERAQTNYDHPDSLESELLVTQLHRLIAGESVEQPLYDFSIHTRKTETQHLEPKRVVIVEGILITTIPELRQLFSIKVFVDTDDDIRFIRRLQRDCSERGRTVEQTIESYLATVKPMYHQFVEPSKRYADVILPEGGYNEVAIDLLLARVNQELLSS